MEEDIKKSPSLSASILKSGFKISQPFKQLTQPLFTHKGVLRTVRVCANMIDISLISYKLHLYQ